MAFKILNSEELSLLNDNQRMQYEKELNLYQQRVAFVERLEMLENVHIEPYEPKLEPIFVMDKIEIRPFIKTEHKITKCDPVVKPDLQIKTFRNVEQIIPALPLVSVARANVKDRYIQKPERIQPDLPTVVEPKIAVTSFNRLENSQANLPTVISPSIKMDIPFENLKNNLHHDLSNIPNIVMPDIDINHVTVPVKTQPILPEVSVHVGEMKTFTKSEMHNTELPTVIKPNININYYKEMKPMQLILPEVSAISYPGKTEFHKPEQQNAELPTVAIPNINSKYFKRTECVITSLPKVSSIDLQLKEKEFRKPDNFALVLPKVSSFNIRIRTFKKHESEKVDLPNIVQPSVGTKSFERFEKIQTNIVTPKISSVAFKEFTKPKRDIPSLPKIKIVEAPDAYSELKSLLTSSEN